MEVDNRSQLELELLVVLRARLSAPSIEHATALCALVADSEATPAAAPDIALRVSDALKSAIRSNLSNENEYLRETIQLLAGLDTRTSSRVVKRSAVIKLEAASMVRARGRWGENRGIGQRRMQQLEKSLVVRAVMEALLESLGKPRRTEHEWRDCLVEVRLYADGKPGVLMRTDLTFKSSQSMLLVAVTDDGALADGICAKHPELTEVFVPSEGVGPEIALAASIRHDGMVHCLDPTDATSGEISAELAITLTSTGIDEVYAVHVPSDLQMELNEFRLTATQRLDVAEGFCYWTSPRSAYVRSIRVDYSGFPLRDRHRFRMRPRLGFPVEVLSSEQLFQYDLQVDSWIAAGCGFEFLWNEMAHEQ